MVSRSPRRWLERRGLIGTYRKPMSTVSLPALRLREIALEPPFPTAQTLSYTQGDPVPDRATSVEWPN